MRILMRDGRAFEGSAPEIVRGMQAIAFGVDHLSLGEYVAWVVENTRRFEGLELEITGGSDDERAESLVREMLRAGLAIEDDGKL